MVISLEKVTKIFKKNRVVDCVTVDFPDSTVSVVTGLSGSGKRTLLRLLAGELKPDSGRIVNKNKGLIAYSEAGVSSFSGLGKSEIHAVWRLLYPDFDEEKFQTLNENDKADAGIFDLSLAAASNAGTMIFYEPLLGLDMEQKPKFLDLFKELAGSGKTVIVAVSEIDGFETVAGRAVVLNGGNLIVAEEVSVLLATHRLFPGATTISPDYKVIGPVFNERLLQTDENIGREATLKEIITGYINGSSS